MLYIVLCTCIQMYVFIRTMLSLACEAGVRTTDDVIDGTGASGGGAEDSKHAPKHGLSETIISNTGAMQWTYSWE